MGATDLSRDGNTSVFYGEHVFGHHCHKRGFDDDAHNADAVWPGTRRRVVVLVFSYNSLACCRFFIFNALAFLYRISFPIFHRV
jgi:hypothetical protein